MWSYYALILTLISATVVAFDSGSCIPPLKLLIVSPSMTMCVCCWCVCEEQNRLILTVTDQTSLIIPYNVPTGHTVTIQDPIRLMKVTRTLTTTRSLFIP